MCRCMDGSKIARSMIVRMADPEGAWGLTPIPTLPPLPPLIKISEHRFALKRLETDIAFTE